MGNKSGRGDTKEHGGGGRGPSPDELASMKPAGRKGWEFRRQASAKLHARSMFGRESRLEQAAELAEKAATQFKLAKMYDDSGDCYAMQAQALQMIDEGNSANRALLAAAQTFVLASNVERAAELWRGAIESLKDQGKFGNAAKESQKLADALKADDQPERAAEVYEEAADLFEMDGRGAASARKCQEERAMILAASGSYEVAAGLFGEIALKCLEKNLSAFRAKEFYQKSAMCYLARGDPVAAQDTIDSASIQDPRFLQSREGKLIAALTQLCAANDADSSISQLQELLGNYNQITAFSNWETNVLFTIKRHYFPEGDAQLENELAGSSDGAGTSGAGANDGDDLL